MLTLEAAGIVALGRHADCVVRWALLHERLKAHRFKFASAQTKAREKPKILAHVVGFYRLRV
jgi:hypothetical protein